MWPLQIKWSFKVGLLRMTLAASDCSFESPALRLNVLLSNVQVNLAHVLPIKSSTLMLPFIFRFYYFLNSLPFALFVLFAFFVRTRTTKNYNGTSVLSIRICQEALWFFLYLNPEIPERERAAFIRRCSANNVNSEKASPVDLQRSL